MPDLMVQAYWHCLSFEFWSTQVPASKGTETYTVTWGLALHGFYQYDWRCSCKSFRFRHKCKHIDQVKGQHCGWDQHIDGGDRTPEGKCPRCGGEVGAHTVGV